VANEVKLTIRVGDDGSLNIIGNEAKKASSAIDGVADSTKRAGAARNKYSKSEKGVAGATSNSTKAFSKMTTGIQGGLVPAYATLAANVFAVTAAFGVLSRSAAVKQLEEGLIFTGRAAGQNLPMVVDGLREITGFAVSTADAMRSVAVGISAGFSQTQIEGLAKVAKGASLALGRDMTDALDRLTRGAAKLEPEILDELGIMVRLDEATETFATTLGKTSSELTQYERRMAFTNAIIEQGERKFAALSMVVDPNPYDKLAASFDNLTKSVLGGLNTAFGPLVGFLADNLAALIGVLGVFATGVVKQAVPALTRAGDAAADFAAELADASKEQIAQAKSFKGAPKVFDQYAEAVSNGTASQADMDKATKSLTKSIDMHNSQMPAFIKEHGEGSKAVEEKRKKLANAEKALLSITTAQQLETQATIQATKADALNAIGQGNLRTALTLTKAAIMEEWAATMLSAKGKGLLAGSLIALRGAFNIAAFSAKAFGLAVLNAIPVIGQIILVISIAWSYLSDFFSEPPSALEEALEENKKRFDEFPEIIRQMNAGIAAAANQAEEFMAALKPTTGILDQVVDAAQNLLDVQKQENIEKQVKARMSLIQANQNLAKSENKVEQATERAMETLNPDTSEMSWWEKIISWTSQSDRVQGAIYGVVAAEKAQARATDEVVVAQEALETSTENLGKIDILKTVEGVQEALVRGIASFDQSKIALADNADAVALLDTKINGLEDILQKLSNGLLSPEGAVEAMQRLASEARAVVESADSAADSVRAITGLFAASARPSGVLADHIEELDKALTNMEAGVNFAAIRKEFEPIFKAYDVDTPEELENIADLFKQVNEEVKNRGMLDEKNKQQAERLKAIGAQSLALQVELERIEERKLAMETQRQALEKAGKVDEARAVALQIEQETTKELQKQLEILRQRAADAERLGGGIMGAGASMSASAPLIATAGSFEEAIIGINAASQQTLQNLKSLGPEGEVYSAVLGGVLNITESWASAIQIIGDTSLSTAERMSAAFQAVGATIQAIGQIQQAQAQASAAAIDKEIQAEKRRDGKSKESVAKIAAMEKRKEAIKKKAFEQDKKMKMAAVVAATAMSVASNLAAASNAAAMAGPAAPAVFSSYLALMNGITIALGAAQLAVIAGTSYQGGGSLPSGGGAPSSIAVGQRKNSVDLAKSQSARGELGYFRGESGTGGPEAFTPAFSGYRNRAEGGNTAFMVGEQGPELFVPQVPGRIVPNDDIAPMTSTNVSFNINTIDASGVEDLLVEQRGNIIGMIRQAANSYGQDFFEGVDTSVFTPSAGGVNRY